MQGFADATLMGNATRDPETRFTPNGTAIAEFSIAVNKTRKGQDGTPIEEVSYLDVVAYGRVAEIIGEYVKKGKGLFLYTTVKQERWDDKEGRSRSRVRFIVEKMILLSDGKGERADDRPERTDTPSRPPKPAAPAPGDAAEPDEHDNIPF